MIVVVRAPGADDGKTVTAQNRPKPVIHHVASLLRGRTLTEVDFIFQG
jgi:hypothetical protein